MHGLTARDRIVRSGRWYLIVALVGCLAGACASDGADEGELNADNGLSAVGADAPTNGRVDDSARPPGGDLDRSGALGESSSSLPDFTVRIVASSTEGNAPMDVEFSVEVLAEDDLDPDALSYAWKVGPHAQYDDAAFVHSFYTPTVAVITVDVTYRAGDGGTVVASDDEQVRILGCADLTFDQISLAPPVEVAQGDLVSFVQAKLRNDGDVIESPFEVWIVLSEDDIYEPESDHVVDVRQIDGMASGQFTEVSFDLAESGFVVPEEVSDGDYFVYLKADAGEVINECQESNNLTKTANNLTVDSSLAFKPDLIVEEVGFAEGLVVNQGVNINYSFRVSNVGEGDAEQFRLAAWLSTDSSFDPLEDLVISGPNDLGSTVQQMTVGATQSFFKSYKIPQDLEPGSYWVIVQVDANEQLAEIDESNNVAVSAYPFAMEYLEPQCADLSLDTLEVAPSITYWDGTVQILAEISNPGTIDVPGGWDTAVYFSLQPSLNPSIATEMNTSNWLMPAVPAGETVIIDELVTVKDTLPVLEHYVGFVLDPDDVLSECAEGNNAMVFATPIDIEAQANVELVANAVAYHPNTVAAGTDVKVTFSVTNTGSSQASSFFIAVALSTDGQLSAAGIAQGLDIVIGQVTVPFLAPATTVEFVEKIPVPIELDATVSANTLYTLGIVVDPTGSQISDTNKNNNDATSSSLLQVTGAQGGCVEDGHEPNNAYGTAAPLEAGTHGDLHSCGNTDWYSVHVPEGHSLHVTASIEPLLSLQEVESNLDLSLYGPDEQLLDESTHTGGTEEVWEFVVDEAADYSIRVFAATPGSRGHYSLHVEVLEPIVGVDLVPSDVEAIPATLYPGGLMNVAWTDNNMGDAPSGAYAVKVWLSKDQTLDVTEDIVVAQMPTSGTGGASSEDHMLQFLLPSDILGGDWYLLAQIDPDGVVGESDTSNNVAASDVVFLDPQMTCADDDHEPNDAPVLATPLDLSAGSASMHHMVACPQLPDWYAVTLAEGQTLVATATYQHDNAKGLLSIELWEPTANAKLADSTGLGSSQVQLPWVWSAGTYLLKVATQPYEGLEAPYSYNLSVAASTGLAANECQGDVFEDNSWIGAAATIGCGLQAATLCEGDIDHYDLVVKGGDTLTITLQHAEAGLKMALYADQGSEPVDEYAGNGQVAYYASAETALLLVVESNVATGQLESTDYTLFMDGVAGTDLIAEDIAVYPSTIDQGEDGVLSYTLSNTCIDDTPPFDVTIWLSQDGALDPTDVDIKTVNVAGVEGKAVIEQSHKVSVPLSTMPGPYWLLVQTDSGAHVAESNEGNNVGAVALAVSQVCLADAMEPNDMLMPFEPVAPIVEVPGAEGLSLCPLDVDWFQVVVPPGMSLTASILFSHADGDLDLRAYDPAYSTSQPVASSQTADDDETITYMPPVGGTVLLRVNGFDGSGAPYALAVAFE